MSERKKQALLPRLSVNRPVTVVMIFVALLVVGYIAYTKIPLEMMPSGFEPPFMGVWVPYPNASPEEVQQQITRPVEEMLGTVRNVQSLRSRIRRDFSWTRVEFKQGTDMDMAYAELRDRMDRVMPDLPDDVERVYVRRFDMDDEAQIQIALRIPEDRDIPDLFYFLDHNLGKKIARIDGVAQVEFSGVEEKSFEIDIDKDKISAHKVDVRTISEEISNSNFTLPSGYVKEGNTRYYIRTTGKLRSIDEIKDLEVNEGVKVEDLGEIDFKVPDQQSIQRIDQEKGVWLSIANESGANTVEVHNAVVAALDHEFATNPALEGIERGFMLSQGQLIIDSIADLQETAMWAGVFAILVLYFFLRHLRMTLVITLAIPISLLITLVAMYFTGETLNLLTLMGLMVSVGLVVDNSVVVLENIFRHRENNKDRKSAAINGASEVGLAVIMATLTTIVVFLPMILMGGGAMMGFFMSRLGFPIVFGLLSSLFVALIFIPLTTTLFKDKAEAKESKIVNFIRNKYSGLLRWVIRRRVETAILGVFLLIGIFMFTSDMGYQSDMQDSIDTRIRIRLGKKYSDISGFPLQLAKRAEAWIIENKEILDFDTMDTRVSDDWVRINLYRSPKRNVTTVLEKPLLWYKNILMINDMQEDPENARRNFIKDNMMKDMGLIEGEASVRIGWGGGQRGGGSLEVSLTGNDYNELRKWGERVQAGLEKIPGVVNVETDIEKGNEELVVTINRSRARSANVEPSLAARTVAAAIRGQRLPKFQEKDREIDITMRLQEEDRRDVNDLMNLQVPTNSGGEIPLAAIASFDKRYGPSSITHNDRKPNYGLTVTYDGERMDKYFGLISNAMKGLGNGDGYSWQFGDGRRRMQEDQSNFMFAASLAIVFVFLLMGVLFESFTLPLTIICAIPFAFAGSQLLLKIYGMPANMFAYIGIIIIVGVVVNNGIVLVDLINRLRDEGMERAEAIAKAGYFRFRPIMMTAGTTVFSLVPMAFGDANLVGIPYNPLGMAMIGGLALNSLLTLVMVPVFYTFFDDLRKVWNDVLARLFGGSKQKQQEAMAASSK